MTDTQRFADRDLLARRYQYAGGEVLAFDLGAGTAGSVDVVDGTVLVVTEGDQHEFDLPEGVDRARASMNNGVVTVEPVDDAGDGGAGTADPTADEADGADGADADTTTDTDAEGGTNTEDER